MRFLRLTVCLLALLLLMVSCRKPGGSNWDVDAVVPVVTSTLNISNFAGDTLFRADNAGLLHLVMNREVGAVLLDSLMEIQDTTIKNDFVSDSPLTLTLTPGSEFPNLKAQTIRFKLDSGIALKRAVVRSARFSAKFSNDLSEPLELIYRIDGATKNGVPFLIHEIVPPGLHTLSRSFDLSDYALNLRGPAGTSYNTLAQSYTLMIPKNGNPTAVPFGKGAHTEVSFNELVPYYVEGYFGRRVEKIRADTARLSFLENFSATNLVLSQASMSFRILNEIGAEFRGSLSGINGINYLNNTTVPLQTNLLANMNINRATRQGDKPVASVKDISFTPANSNVTAFISNLPDAITYSGSVQVNPLGNISGYNDFAYYNTGLRIVADLDIPLRFTAGGFLLQSRNEVSFGGARGLEDVNYGQLVVSVTNGFPFSAYMQAYLYDEHELLLDSLFLPGANLISGGSVDGQNIVVASSHSELRIPVDQVKIDHLKRAHTITMRSRFLLPPNPPEIQVLEHYQMGINIVAEFNYRARIR